MEGTEGPAPVFYLGYHSSQEAKAAVASLRARINAAQASLDLNDKLLEQASDENFRLRLNPPDTATSDRRVEALLAERAGLIREKAQALAEMAAGEFCSGCGRTRSEILRTGSVFPHPGQSVIKATPEQMARKAAEFDARIRTLDEQIDRIRENLIRQVQEKWQQAVTRTDDMMDAAAQDREKAGNELDSLRRQLIDAETAVRMLALMERWAHDAWTKAEERSREQRQREQRRSVAAARREADVADRQVAFWRARLNWLANLEAAAWGRHDNVAAEAARQEWEVAKGKLAEATGAQTVAESHEREAGGTTPVGAPADKAAAADSASGLAQLYATATGASRRTWDSGVDTVRKIARQEAATLGDDFAGTFKRMQDRYLRENLDQGPKTLANRVAETYHSSLDELLGREKEAPATLAGVVRNQVLDRISGAIRGVMEDWTKREFVGAALEVRDGSFFDSTDDAELARAQRDFDLEASPEALFYESAPFVGGRSVFGFKKYGEAVQAKFFKWFGLATDRISSTDP
ncbi:MAG TPA: hypothetical protein VG936_10000 [Lacunisphaera sp.]|nr:hypothetical protein [Lacunisphaera sp.]